MVSFNREKLETVLNQLRQAIYHHERWHRELMRCIVCNLPNDPNDAAPDAHRHCRFGHWIYNEAPDALRSHPSFVTIETEHRHMHELAARLLSAATTHTQVGLSDYDDFANVLDRLRIDIAAFERDLQHSLYSRDPLTGAENRMSMLIALREAHESARRSGRTASIALMDIDHFKLVNDSRGHRIGDEVLVAAVRLADAMLGRDDKIFRYGGEEFLILMPGTDLLQAQGVAGRLREGLAKAILTQDGEVPVQATASFGLAPLDPQVSVEESIHHADMAMYAAKAAGRNCVRSWDAAHGGVSSNPAE